MKKFAALVWIMVFVSAAQGTQHLTINGQEAVSITLGLDESCTIEVVSDDGASYTNVLALNNLVVSDLALLEIKSEAGANAWAINTTESSYNIHAGGAGVSAGTHFVFQYVGQEVGIKSIELREFGGFTPIDSIQITVAEPNSAGTVFTYQGRLTEGGTPA